WPSGPRQGGGRHSPCPQRQPRETGDRSPCGIAAAKSIARRHGGTEARRKNREEREERKESQSEWIALALRPSSPLRLTPSYSLCLRASLRDLQVQESGICGHLIYSVRIYTLGAGPRLPPGLRHTRTPPAFETEGFLMSAPATIRFHPSAAT